MPLASSPRGSSPFPLVALVVCISCPLSPTTVAHRFCPPAPRYVFTLQDRYGLVAPTILTFSPSLSIPLARTSTPETVTFQPPPPPLDWSISVQLTGTRWPLFELAVTTRGHSADVETPVLGPLVANLEGIVPLVLMARVTGDTVMSLPKEPPGLPFPGPCLLAAMGSGCLPRAPSWRSFKICLVSCARIMKAFSAGLRGEVSLGVSSGARHGSLLAERRPFFQPTGC